MLALALLLLTGDGTVLCCKGGACTTVSADVGCAVAPLAPVRTRSEGPRPLTLEQRWARALVSDDFSHVVIGTIEGEEAFVDHDGAIRTWCTIRVQRAYRGDVPANGLLRVLYDGGAIDVDRQRWPSVGPRCLPFDYGVFTLYVDGADLRPTDLSTVSMLASELEWMDHPWTATLDALARDLPRW